MKITACPLCGSKRIHTGTLGAGVTFGVTSWNYVCEQCNYQGQPLEFSSKQEYERFLKAVKQQEKKNDDEQEVEQQDDEPVVEDEQFQQFVQEALADTSSLSDTHPFEKKRWWPEFIISVFGSFSITYLLFLPHIRLLLDDFFLVLYSFFLFVFWIVSLMALFVIIEYAIISVRRTFNK